MNKLHYLDINCNLIFNFGWRKKIWSETLKEQYDLYVDMIIWPMNFVIYAPCVYKRLNSWLLLHEKLTIIQLISHVSGLYEWISLSLWSCTKYKACACFLPLARYHRSPSQRCTHTHTRVHTQSPKHNVRFEAEASTSEVLWLVAGWVSCQLDKIVCYTARWILLDK